MEKILKTRTLYRDSKLLTEQRKVYRKRLGSSYCVEISTNEKFIIYLIMQRPLYLETSYQSRAAGLQSWVTRPENADFRLKI